MQRNAGTRVDSSYMTNSNGRRGGGHKALCTAAFNNSTNRQRPVTTEERYVDSLPTVSQSMHFMDDIRN